MDDKVHLWTSSDGQKAVLSILSNETTEDDIRFQLTIQGIVGGIRWDVIRAALKKATLSGEPQYNIPAADVTDPEYVIVFGTETFCAKPGPLSQITDRLSAAGAAIAGIADGGYGHSSGRARYVKGDECFCFEGFTEAPLDIFGKRLTNLASLQPHFKCSAAIQMNRTDDRIEYHSRKNGYVVIDAAGMLDISEATVVSADKMRIDFVFLPVLSGGEALVDDFFAALAKFNPAFRNAPPTERDRIGRLVKAGQAAKETVARGVPPVIGKDARLAVHVAVKRSPVEDEKGRIDMRELSVFMEVTAGSVIATKCFPVNGSAGKNVLGETIPVAAVKDIPFDAGENVSAKTMNGSILYIAEKTGMLRLTERCVAVSEVLHIKDNVSHITGNLHSSNSIIIDGDIASGFTVECGGDLVVNGSIENGAIVRCSRDMVVSHGIFGENANIFVNGDAEVRFIQNSAIRVNGNLLVGSFVRDSRLWCGGHLRVRGEDAESRGKGCVIGGTIVAMRSLDLFSAGSSATTTRLHCGIDPEALEVAKAVKEKIFSLNRRAIRLQGEIGIDFKRPDAAERLRNAPNREALKGLLVQLKAVSQEQETYMKKLPELQKKALTEVPESCRIIIRRSVFPDVVVRIADGTTLISEPMREVTINYRLGKGIVISKGNHWL